MLFLFTLWIKEHALKALVMLVQATNLIQWYERNVAVIEDIHSQELMFIM